MSVEDPDHKDRLQYFKKKMFDRISKRYSGKNKEEFKDIESSQILQSGQGVVKSQPLPQRRQESEERIKFLDDSGSSLENLLENLLENPKQILQIIIKIIKLEKTVGTSFLQFLPEETEQETRDFKVNLLNELKNSIFATQQIQQKEIDEKVKEFMSQKNIKFMDLDDLKHEMIQADLRRICARSSTILAMYFDVQNNFDDFLQQIEE